MFLKLLKKCLVFNLTQGSKPTTSFSLVRISVLIFYLFLFNGVSIAFDSNCANISSGGKGDAASFAESYPSPSWALCIKNTTNTYVTYQKRWGHKDPWDTHTLAPNQFRAHWCNPQIAECIAPLMIKWSDVRGEINLPLQHYIVGPGCIRCSQAKLYYFWTDGKAINLSDWQ